MLLQYDDSIRCIYNNFRMQRLSRQQLRRDSTVLGHFQQALRKVFYYIIIIIIIITIIFIIIIIIIIFIVIIICIRAKYMKCTKTLFIPNATSSFFNLQYLCL